MCNNCAILGPQAPKLSLLSSGENSAVVQWTTDNSTGIAKTFKLYVTFDSTIYETVANCEENFQKKFSHVTTDSSINITSLQPFSTYTVKIRAENDYGISDSSKKLSLTTRPSTPSPPRDPSISFIPSTNNHVISAVLKWKAPCKLNGLFSLFTVALKGVKFGFNDHILREATSYHYLNLKDLKRGYKYEAKIQAIASDFPGEHLNFVFKTPSGSELSCQ